MNDYEGSPQVAYGGGAVYVRVCPECGKNELIEHQLIPEQEHPAESPTT